MTNISANAAVYAVEGGSRPAWPIKIKRQKPKFKIGALPEAYIMKASINALKKKERKAPLRADTSADARRPCSIDR